MCEYVQEMMVRSDNLKNCFGIRREKSKSGLKKHEVVLYQIISIPTIMMFHKSQILKALTNVMQYEKLKEGLDRRIIDML